MWVESFETTEPLDLLAGIVCGLEVIFSSAFNPQLLSVRTLFATSRALCEQVAFVEATSSSIPGASSSNPSPLFAVNFPVGSPSHEAQYDSGPEAVNCSRAPLREVPYVWNRVDPSQRSPARGAVSGDYLLPSTHGKEGSSSASEGEGHEFEWMNADLAAQEAEEDAHVLVSLSNSNEELDKDCAAVHPEQKWVSPPLVMEMQLLESYFSVGGLAQQKGLQGVEPVELILFSDPQRRHPRHRLPRQHKEGIRPMRRGHRR